MIGLAMATEEYVPKTMPIRSASEKPRSTSPPKSTRESTERKTRPEVMIVRESVWLIESLVTS